MTGVTFETNDLQTDNILTATIEHEGMPEKVARMYALAHANRSTIDDPDYPSRSIRLTGKIVGSSIADLDSRLDTFKSYFNKKDGNLDIDYDGGTRRYIATLTALSIPRPGGLNHAQYVADFTCTQPFGRDITETTALSASGRTSATYTDNYTFLGSAPFQLPIVTITINSVTDGNDYIFWGDNTTGQGIAVYGPTFAADDELVINCEDYEVTLNGDPIDFHGGFPEFAPGARTFAYSDGFTARNFDIDVVYNKLWL